jgi:hypothetical protein
VPSPPGAATPTWASTSSEDQPMIKSDANSVKAASIARSCVRITLRGRKQTKQASRGTDGHVEGNIQMMLVVRVSERLRA